MCRQAPSTRPAPRSGIRIEHTDLQGARSWMSAICGPHELSVHTPQRLTFRHDGHVLPSLSTTLGCIEYGTDVTVQTSPSAPLNCYSISLPLTGEQELSTPQRRHRSSPEVGIIVAPDADQRLMIGGNCRKLQVAITRQAMQQALDDLLQGPHPEPLVFEPVMDAVAGPASAWWRLVRHWHAEMAQTGQGLFGSVHLSSDLEKTLIKGLILSQPSNYSARIEAQQQPRVPHYLRAAQRFITAHAQEPLRLEDIEAAAGVSRDKLFQGFQRCWGTSPMAYLKRHRLEQVRRALLEDRAYGNVSSIAMAWGFNHLGRFSQDYKQLFGESPSHTVARRRALG